MKRAGMITTLLVLLLCGGCGSAQTTPEQTASEVAWSDVKAEDTMPLEYAEQFSVQNYTDAYKLITVAEQQKYLLVPEGKPVPSGLEDDVTVLQQPLDNIYLVATSAMDYFRELNAIDDISLSGTQEKDWYIEEAKQAMEDGSMTYAGKYSTPDYELITATGCDLAIESTMIYHTPKVKEQLESMGTPVFVDYSSYEAHPLGRMEWLKLYGVLLGKQEQAQQAYDALLTKLQPVLDAQKTDKTVAFFYITSNGAVSVRKSGDYVAKAIELSGGNYIFSDLEDDTATASMNMQMERFYSQAKDADILIYNSTIEGELTDMSQLLEKSSMLADFKAVQNGNVWCTEKNLFQESLGLGNLMVDFHTVIQNQQASDDELTYLHRLKQ